MQALKIYIHRTKQAKYKKKEKEKEDGRKEKKKEHFIFFLQNRTGML